MHVPAMRVPGSPSSSAALRRVSPWRGEASVQAAALEGERILILEDELLIALNIQEICETEGATVVLAPTVPQALRFAENPAVSAGILDIRVGCEDAEPVCEALGRRR